MFRHQFMFALQLVLVFSKELDYKNYPEIEVFMSPVEKPDHFIVPDKQRVVNGTTNYTVFSLYKPLFKIQNLTFTCTFVEPIEWFFECADTIVENTLSMTKQIRLYPTSNKNVEYEYRIALTMRNINTGTGTGTDFESSLEDFPNTTCRLSHRHHINSSIVIKEHEDNKNITIAIQNNLGKSKTNDCTRNSSKCPVRMMVDLYTATYSCSYELISTNISIHSQISNRKQLIAANKDTFIRESVGQCNDKMDYCNSLVESSKSCINFTRNQTLPNVLKTTSNSGIISCKTSNGKLTVTQYYTVLEKTRNKQRYLNQIDQVFLHPELLYLVIRPEIRIPNIYYDGQPEVLFICQAWSSLFSMGSVISTLYENKTQILIDPPGNEILDETEDKTSVYIKAVNITMHKNMTGIICNSSVLFSKEWKHTIFNITVLDSEKPEIVNHTIFIDKVEISFQCDCIGTPKPTITWFKRLQIPVEFDNPAKDVRINIIPKSFQPNVIASKISIKKTDIGNSTIICIANSFVGEAMYEFNKEEIGDTYVENGTFNWTVLSFLIVLTILAIMIMSFLFYNKWKRHGATRLLSEEDCNEFYKGIKFCNQSDPLSGALLLAYDINFEVPRDEIIMEEIVLGKGEFGIVIQGQWKGVTVAVKTIRHTTDIKYFKALLAEMKILQYIGNHPYICNLLGACTKNIRKMEVLLLLDFCENGNLVKFLRSCRSTFIDLYHYTEDDKVPLYENNSVRSVTTVDLVRMGVQIAEAMSFIADKQILHGDLAARNILVTNDKNIKVSDFGLAKELFQYVQKQECPLPLRWMAIESLQDMEFSIQSDVWAAGVVLYEIFSLGEMPYPGVSWSFASWRMLKDGYRMEAPSHANNSIYQIMLECWSNDPSDRPTFSYLSSALRKEYDALREYT